MRFAVSFILAIVVALSLFFLMQYMISGGRGGLNKIDSHSVIEFIRLKKDADTQIRKRTKPKKPPPPKQPPPPPKLKVAKSPDTKVPHPNMKMPELPSQRITGGPFMGSVGGGDLNEDGDAIPYFKIPPQYPRKALIAGKEGWVNIAFTITPEGTVVNPRVVDSKPRRLFDRAAIKAILKYKFKPKIVDGKAVERKSTQLIEFKLEKE